MAGFMPAIHVLPAEMLQDVDARHEAGHDAEFELTSSIRTTARPQR
jgi:hypothetical protein